MEINSSVFQNNSFLPEKYTCDGENINPPLKISNIPSNTKSLVLIVDDPDANNWTHWIVLNIPPNTFEISENSIPSNATEGITSWGKPGYSGPCPPSGIHRYFFKLFAVDTVLDLSPQATVDQILIAMQNHLVAQTKIIAKYSKK